jgi:hypothetical protein
VAKRPRDPVQLAKQVFDIAIGEAARIHKTLRITPSMAAGLSDHVWSLEEIILMADAAMPKLGKRGPYKKQ